MSPKVRFNTKFHELLAHLEPQSHHFTWFLGKQSNDLIVLIVMSREWCLQMIMVYRCTCNCNYPKVACIQDQNCSNSAGPSIPWSCQRSSTGPDHHPGPLRSTNMSVGLPCDSLESQLGVGWSMLPMWCKGCGPIGSHRNPTCADREAKGNLVTVPVPFLYILFTWYSFAPEATQSA